MQAAVHDIYIDVLVQEYIVKLTDSTRKHDAVYLGASPRGSLALQRLGQARAVLDGRDYVLPDDVKRLAYPALGHRIILNAQARVKGLTPAQVVDDCLQHLPVPGVPGGFSPCEPRPRGIACSGSSAGCFSRSTATIASCSS